MTGDLSFGDNDKAIFGASTNLEIYANGGYSYIDEVGLNNLNIRTNGANIGIYDTANSQYMAKFTTGGDAELYHNGSEKLATTSTGINVTGTVTADGLTVDGNATITTADNSTNLSLVSTDADASVGPVLDLYRNSASPADNDVTGRIIFSAENDADEKIEYQRIITYMPDVSDGSEDGAFQHYIMKDGTRIQRLEHSPTESVFNQDSADVDFRVESNGNANMLFVDGGNDRVGIGTSSPSVSLTTLAGTANTAIARFSGSEGARGLVIETASTTRDDDTVVFNASDAFGRISFETNSTQRMTIDTSGNVTASNSVGVSGNAGMPVLQQAAGSASFPSYSFYDDGNTGMFRPSADALAFATGGSEVVRLSGGNLLVGLSAVEAVGTSAGTQLRADGLVYAAATSDAHILSRRSTDGSILNFRKDTTTVGSIASVGGLIQFGQGNANLKFSNASDVITPANGSGTDNNNAIDLGSSSAAFKSLYLSGTIGADSSTAFTSMDGRLMFDNDYSSSALGPNKVVLQAEGNWVGGLGISNNFLDIYTGGGIRFNKSASQTSYSAQMTLDASGNLGIGTSSVSAGFLVEGTGDARFGDTAGDDAVELGWSQGGGYAFVQAYDRNASAQRDLLLNGVVKVLATGDVRFSGNSHTPYIQLANSGRVASNPGYSFNNDTNSGMYQPSGAADTVAFSTAGTERLRLSSTGHAMLGTTSDEGASGNTKKMVAGHFTTKNGATTIASTGVATTLHSLASQSACFLVSAMGSGTGNIEDNTTAILHMNNSATRITTIHAGSRVVLSMSGTNLQVTQSIFGGAVITWSIMRIR